MASKAKASKSFAVQPPKTIEEAVEQTFGMKPGLDRATFLPIAGQRSMGTLQLAAPGVLYDAAKALVTPMAALRGVNVTPEEALNVAANVMGGGLGASALRPVEGGALTPMNVYHGTPHRFPATEANPLGEFDASKIGTGEGAQAYGHGIYVAESPDVAKSYADTLGVIPDPVVYLDPGMSQKAAEYARNALKTRGYDPSAAAKALFDSKNMLSSKEARTASSEAISAIKHGRARVIAERDYPEGHVYKVDLPDEMIDRMLDWDKPFAKQPEAVKKALRDSGLYKEYRANLSNFASPMGTRNPNMRGENFAAYLEHKLGGQQQVSEYLRTLGIPGIKYLDAGSRGAGGSGTRNFVVFPGEEKKVKILERKARGGAVSVSKTGSRSSRRSEKDFYRTLLRKYSSLLSGGTGTSNKALQFAQVTPSTVGKFGTVYDPKTGREFVSPSQALAAGVTNYVSQLPSDFALPSSLQGYDSNKIGELAAKYGMTPSEFVNYQRQGEIRAAASQQMRDKMAQYSTTLSPEELTARLQAYKANPPKTEAEMRDNQALWADYSQRYAQSTWNYANMGGKPKDYSLQPSSSVVTPSGEFRVNYTGYADPINQFLNKTQGTPDFTMAQNALAKHPVISEAMQKVIDVVGAENFNKMSGVNNYTALTNIAKDIEKFGEATALRNYYGKMSNIFGDARTAISGYDPIYDTLHKMSVTTYPKLEDEAFYQAVPKAANSWSKPVAIYRDPTSGFGISVDIDAKTGMPAYFTAYDPSGQALRPTSFDPSGLYNLAESYGINLSGIGTLGEQLKKQDIGYTPGSLIPGTGSMAGIDFADIARGGLGASTDWTVDPNAALKGPSAASQLAENVALAQRLGLKLYPDVTTGVSLDPSKFAPLTSGAANDLRNYVVYAGGDTASWYGSQDEANTAAQQYPGSQVINLATQSLPSTVPVTQGPVTPTTPGGLASVAPLATTAPATTAPANTAPAAAPAAQSAQAPAINAALDYSYDPFGGYYAKGGAVDLAKKTAKKTGAEMRPIPRQPVLGSLADITKAAKDIANKVYFKEEVPLLGGVGLGELLMGETPEELNRWSTGDLPMRMQKYGLGQIIPTVKPGRSSALMDLAFTAAPLRAPVTRGIRAIPEGLKMAGEDLLRAGVTGSPAIVKPRGGQWVASDVRGSPEAIAETLKLDNPIGPEKSINDWLESTLTKYIKRDLGTAEDPVRALAEKGVLHYEPTPLATGAAKLVKDKRTAQLGQSELAKKWEDVSDLSVEPFTAGELRQRLTAEELEAMPWILNVPEETPVYETFGTRLTGHRLGMSSLRDQLLNAVDPESSLPKNLQLRPESLSRMSMPQAVEHVAKINKWKADNASKKILAAAEGIPVHKEYAEGFKWLSPGDTRKDKKAMQYIKEAGCDLGWCTKEEGAALNYGSGDSRVYILSDNKGKPLAQISTVEKEGELPDIQEIQGPFNKPPTGDTLKYVQDFVKSKKWGFVGDPERVGLLKVGGEYLTQPELEKKITDAIKAVSSIRPITSDDAFAQSNILGVLHDYGTRELEVEDIEDALWRARKYVGEETKFAKGGAVDLAKKYGLAEGGLAEKYGVKKPPMKGSVSRALDESAIKMSLMGR